MSPTPRKCSVRLEAVLGHLAAKNLVKSASADVAGLSGPAAYTVDSRQTLPGGIFIAYQGVAADGHQHLEKAAILGARLVIVENKERVPANLGVPYIEVTSGRAAWTYLASLAAGEPEQDLTFIGVTGTNGKTSTVWMTAGLLRANGIPCLSIGTLGASFGGEFVPTGHTTPDPELLFSLLADAKARGIKHVAMEVSSHAVVQEKLLPLRFAACAFTSFSRDHLDFHQTMDEYFAAKWQLFTALAAPGARLVFWDGLDRQLALSKLTADTVIYGSNPRARQLQWGAARTVKLDVEQTGFTGTTLTLKGDTATWRGTVPYFAKHALENFAAAYLLAEKALGREPSEASLAELRPVPGRLEQVIGQRGGPSVVVDYAHTPDALDKTLDVLRPLCRGKLVVVFGCGGDRDKGKRPVMGRIAEEKADRVYVTSDNPRSEEPRAIIADITAGLAHREKAVVEPDRARAIERSITEAGPGDTVLVAGKGHETYQIIKGETLAFDDRDVARQVLAKLNPE